MAKIGENVRLVFAALFIGLLATGLASAMGAEDWAPFIVGGACVIVLLWVGFTSS